VKLFGPLYDRCIVWARHRHAPAYLFGTSVAESIFFPVPVDVMLAPMALAQPRRWWRLALLCTIGSVLGGLIGYLLGHYALEAVMPWLQKVGYEDTFLQIHGLFARYGFWIVVIAGFTPIPYKVFTIASGAAGMGLLPFVLGSLVGRAGRFFMVAGLVAFMGPKFEPVLRRYIETIGWVVGVAVLLALAWLQWRH
jgi:membrane protein YqaA with SNARE-associated domain